MSDTAPAASNDAASNDAATREGLALSIEHELQRLNRTYNRLLEAQEALRQKREQTFDADQEAALESKAAEVKTQIDHVITARTQLLDSVPALGEATAQITVIRKDLERATVDAAVLAERLKSIGQVLDKATQVIKGVAGLIGAF